jgi:hypothetical protein
MAIVGGQGGCADLPDIVSSLDYLNRAMPTESEFELSVNHLVGAGLVEVTPEGFGPTNAGTRLLNSLGDGGVIGIMFELMENWDGKEVPDLYPDFEFALPPGAWDVAQAESQEFFLKWMARYKSERNSQP